MSKITKADLLRSLAHEQQEATLLRWTIRALIPPQGWLFVRSPRGFQGYLVKIDEEAFVTYYDMSIGSSERSALLGELYRVELDGPYFDSFLSAMRDEQMWRAELTAPNDGRVFYGTQKPSPEPGDLPPVLDPSNVNR